MDSIDFLKNQHREAIGLFDKFEQYHKAHDMKNCHATFEKLADMLAIHTEIEERFFYPAAAKNKDTQDLVTEAFEEHRELKKLLLDAMKGMNNPGFSGIVAAIRGGFEHHMEEEENEMFPKVKKAWGKDHNQQVYDQMEKLYKELDQKGNARKNIKVGEPAKVHA